VNSRGRFAPYVIGTGLLASAAAAAAFAGYAMVVGEPARGFLICALITLPAGAALRRSGRARAEPSRREALLSVLLCWLLLPLAAAVPFALSGGLGWLDAVFESMSGFTTTGATVLVDFAAVPNSLLLWRALSQWVGGIGILVLFVAVFPQLRIAGRQMYFAEAPGAAEEPLAPRIRHAATAVLSLYGALTVACALAYAMFGMSPFDAVAHSLTTVSAGGFSTQAEGFAAYGSAGLEWVAILFMFLAGISFVLLYRALAGRPRALARDQEFRLYCAILLAAAAVVWLILASGQAGSGSLRQAIFQAVSVLTSAGFASADYALWPQSAQAVLLMLMFIGGSTGSAGGGVKVARWLIIAKVAIREVRRTLHPRAVLPVQVGRRVVSEEVLRAVAGFITLYVALFAFLTVALVFAGEEMTVAFSAAIAAIGNTGVGLSEVGPMGNFAGLEPVSRGLLIFGMFAGRLEVVTVFVIFVPGWWRLPRDKRPRRAGRG